MKIEVYILYSVAANRYYIGYTKDLNNRLDLYKTGVFEKSFTSYCKDWEVFYSIRCESVAQARRIETHLKKMKSKKYLENLKLYSEITERLLEKYR